MKEIERIKFIDKIKRKSFAERDRSVISESAELNLRILNNRRIFTSEENAMEYLAKKAEANENPFLLPTSYSRKFHAVMSGFDFKQVIVYNENSTSGKVILYLHGGSYVDEITPFHLLMLGKIAAHTHDKILVPLYPRAPKHHFAETYEFLEKLYASVSADAKKIVLMGDSAGGGLAVAFCEYLHEKKMRKPDFLIALSPWLDISNSNPAEAEYEAKDPMLCAIGLTVMGKAWAEGTDLQDYRVSPKFGDLSGLDNVCLYVGTREIFYPDVVEFYDRLKEAGKNPILHVGLEMNHVYPCFPVPEGRAALKQIIGLIRLV